MFVFVQSLNRKAGPFQFKAGRFIAEFEQPVNAILTHLPIANTVCGQLRRE
jgi:hypothetical protein